MEKTYCVYMHKFPNGKKYIGISSDAEKRWRNGKGYEAQTKIANAVNLYGWDNIEHIVIVDGLKKEQAERIEQFLISELDTIENGYNTAIGGDNINSTYLNEHVLYMIRESKRFDKMYSSEQRPDDIVSIAELGKTNKGIAAIVNEIDEKIEQEYGEYKRYYGGSPIVDLGERRVDCYWWYVKEILEYGKPRMEYSQYLYGETFQAIENARKGVGLSRGFSTVAELMEDLNSDD